MSTQIKGCEFDIANSKFLGCYFSNVRYPARAMPGAAYLLRGGLTGMESRLEDGDPVIL
jgi:hypothetical protein